MQYAASAASHLSVVYELGSGYTKLCNQWYTLIAYFEVRRGRYKSTIL